MRRFQRCAAAVILTAVLSSWLAACGEAESPPSERVPALARQLEKVDEAVESGDYDQARAAVEELVAKTAQAQVKGDLSSEQADDILSASRLVLENLPSEDGVTEDETEDGG